jgi:signal transduction histidine kinase
LAPLASIAFDAIAEAELQEAAEAGRRKILDHVLNQIEDALLIVDETQEIRYSNQASHNLFPGEKVHEGSQLIEICLDHRIVETVSLAFETGSKMQDQFEFASASKTLLIAAEPIDPAFQVGSGAWILIRDITAELQTEQIRKDFVANASHELRTPLSIISGYLEMLDEEVDSNTLNVLRKHTERVTRIVEDMLTISKLESTDESDDPLLKKEAFDLSDSVFGIIEQLQPLIDQHQARVEIDFPEPGQREFFGDRFYFDQIFFNLIENALKQNPKPGLKITVRVERDQSAGRFNIEVIDNGIGIPASDLANIFKRFYRVEKHHSQAIKGTGLGLSIVKRAVEAHHGSISVTSQPGRRTCFRITLPAPSVKANGPGASKLLS